ncbi:MAG: hypothetical protein E7604_12910 [Ruminococcaceae bacterium]|nr:hypothetical protein [Oscillospiraceae bacterium]
MLDITHYRAAAPALSRTYRLALVTDLHNCRWDQTAAAIRQERADAVVIAGDLLGNLHSRGAQSLEFLRNMTSDVPVFYGLGNHERLLKPDEHEVIRATGAQLLINEAAAFGELVIGGLRPDMEGQDENLTETHLAFIRAFAEMPGYRILLCHRPEWYSRGIRDYDIPLVLSGHAHGGQIRLFGQPIFSPGQGLFPKYAQGMHEGRLIVSRGLGNHTICPRFFNAPELCMITIGADADAADKG